MELIEISILYIIKNWIELFGAFTGLICVYLNVKENILAFPLAIITCSFYVVFFFITKFYADMGLNVIFIALSITGWYQWLHGGENKNSLQITRAGTKELLCLVIAGCAFTALAFFYFSNYTDAASPFFDSYNTAFSLVAQFLINKKKLENWLFWIMVDLIYVPMFLIREKYPTAALYLMYLILATIGYLSWKKTILAQSQKNITIK